MMKKQKYLTPESEQLELRMNAPLAASLLESESTLETFSEETYVW